MTGLQKIKLWWTRQGPRRMVTRRAGRSGRRNVPLQVCGGAFLAIAGIITMLLATTPAHRELLLTREFSISSNLPGLLECKNGATWSLRLSSNDVDCGSVVLRGSLQEKPSMFLPGEKKTEFLCIYLHDTHMEVMVFDTSTTANGQVLKGPLSWIIMSSPWNVRRMTSKDDFGALASRVEQLDDKEIRRLSLPTVSLGPFCAYAGREEIVARLRKRADPSFSIK